MSEHHRGLAGVLGELDGQRLLGPVPAHGQAMAVDPRVVQVADHRRAQRCAGARAGGRGGDGDERGDGQRARAEAAGHGASLPARRAAAGRSRTGIR